MFRIRKETKLFLVVVTIVLSIFLGIKRSNLDKIFVQSDVRIDLSKADDIFENSFNNKKINFEFNVQDLTEINTLLTDVSTMDNANILHSELKSTYNLSVFEIPIDASDDVVSKLRSIDGISNESIQKAGIVMVNTNLKENLNNNQIAKKRIQKLINESVSPDRITSFRNQLDMVQAKIDSLGIQEEIQKHNAEFDIIMLSAVRNINGNAALRSSLSVFILTTIASLLLIIVGLIISYYIFVLMYKLMLVLGIRTSRGSSSNYNYNYNKKGYGRKVKRVYKDADGKVIKKEEKE
ncbi:MAG: hypothetical protein HOK80_07495 [Candidatus Cloacimonetes bacterium]|jgi:hypothetical protein|nr:hypothetical protein [Candidatus Cloacimonadota bacterium]MBT5420720.1 hypothetical protein [Candidatus Cloacimonadota bacterium]